jgi:DNA-binding response OmpR family regulator
MSYLLIVDDDEDFATAVATVLRSSGHDVRIESELSAAIRTMTERRPDLVVLDVMFPENSTGGFEIARQMRWNHDTLKDVPILMLTAVNTRFPLGFSSKDIDEDWLPVTDFLEKPVDLDVLAERVADLKNHRSARPPCPVTPHRVMTGVRRSR